MLIGKLAKWLVLLTEFDIVYMTKKTIKGRAIADFLALTPRESDEQFEFEFPDEGLNAIEVQGWVLYFDGAVNYKGAGIGILLITPTGEQIPLAKKLEFPVTNNMAEYEACIFGLESTGSIGAKEISVYGDSKLVVSQATEEWEVRDEKLKLYVEHLQQLKSHFHKCNMFHLPRGKNQMADALATLASVWEEPNKIQGKPLVMTKANRPCFQREEVVCFIGPQEKPWFHDVLKYLEAREYPAESTSKQRYAIRLQSRSYTFHDDVLYRR